MVEPTYEYDDGVLYAGDVNNVLAELPEESVDCIVTSPPYFGLRDYGTATWVGGDANCTHEFGRHLRGGTLGGKDSNFQNNNMGSYGDEAVKIGESCPKCGAVRRDLQVGLEQTPQEYIDRLVEVFRGLKKVLKKDGVAWLNLGDTYWGGKGRSGAGSKKTHKGRTSKTLQKEHTYLGKSKDFRPQDRPSDVFKPKDLMMIPHRVAIALQEDGWWVRQDIVWNKPNPMPESIRDRCTKAHEYIFLLTKSKKYFYDNEAIKEPVKQDWGTRNRKNGKYHNEGSGLQPHSGLEKSYKTKNKRSVWTIAPKPFKGAHFATFPPKLIEPCILAGTSAKGNCSDCGAPIKRIVQTNNPSKQSADYDNDLNWANTNQKTSNPQSSKSLHRNKGGVYSSAITKGWKSTCECNGEIRPSVVLDPFVGSGTTCVVAKQHGRHFIGIDLNEEYLEIARKRIEDENDNNG
jgi:DNA modification methylase